MPTRRALFGLVAAVPVALVAKADDAELDAVDLAPEPSPTEGFAYLPPSPYPLGYIIDVVEYMPDPCMPSHVMPACGGRTKRQIWDGERFVDYYSAEGTATINRMLRQASSLQSR